MRTLGVYLWPGQASTNTTFGQQTRELASVGHCRRLWLDAATRTPLVTTTDHRAEAGGDYKKMLNMHQALKNSLTVGSVVYHLTRDLLLFRSEKSKTVYCIYGSLFNEIFAFNFISNVMISSTFIISIK